MIHPPTVSLKQIGLCRLSEDHHNLSEGDCALSSITTFQSIFMMHWTTPLVMSMKKPTQPLPTLGLDSFPTFWGVNLYIYFNNKPKVGRDVLWLSSVPLLSFNNRPSPLGAAIKIQLFLKGTNLPLPQGSITTAKCQCNLNVKTVLDCYFTVE